MNDIVLSKIFSVLRFLEIEGAEIQDERGERYIIGWTEKGFPTPCIVRTKEKISEHATRAYEDVYLRIEWGLFISIIMEMSHEKITEIRANLALNKVKESQKKDR